MKLLSLPCPKCDGRMDVKDSRPSTYQGRASVRRRRRCRQCGERCTTYEIIEELHQVRNFRDVVVAARRMKDAADNLLAVCDGESLTPPATFDRPFGLP